jgi:hypothetical protein
VKAHKKSSARSIKRRKKSQKYLREIIKITMKPVRNHLKGYMGFGY